MNISSIVLQTNTSSSTSNFQSSIIICRYSLATNMLFSTGNQLINYLTSYYTQNSFELIHVRSSLGDEENFWKKK